MTLGERIKQERERLGLNQTDFAGKGNVTRRSQSHYESGERSPDAAYLVAISAAGVDVQYVLTGQRSMVEKAEKPVQATPSAVQEKKTGAYDAECPAIDAEALAGVIEGVEKSLASHRLMLAPDKKAQVVVALYDYFKATGRPSPAAVERYLKLAS